MKLKYNENGPTLKKKAKLEKNIKETLKWKNTGTEFLKNIQWTHEDRDSCIWWQK